MSEHTNPPPSPTFELTVKVGSCDWSLVVEELERTAQHVREHGPTCNLVSGGAGRTCSVQVVHHQEVTEQSYRAALHAWWQDGKAQRDDPKGEG